MAITMRNMAPTSLCGGSTPNFEVLNKVSDLNRSGMFYWGEAVIIPRVKDDKPGITEGRNEFARIVGLHDLASGTWLCHRPGKSFKKPVLRTDCRSLTLDEATDLLTLENGIDWIPVVLEDGTTEFKSRNLTIYG
jgi:hypothetical protein